MIHAVVHTRLCFYFRQLLDMVCRIGNVLRKDKDVKKGDLVVIYMPVCPLAVASMLACTRIGAVHRYTNIGNLAKALDRPIFLELLNLNGD